METCVDMSCAVAEVSVMNDDDVAGGDDDGKMWVCDGKIYR